MYVDHTTVVVCVTKMLSRRKGVRFGEKIVPKFISLQSLLELLYNDLTIDYTLLMPILLFLPCFTSPQDMIQILIHDFQNLSTMTTKDSGEMIAFTLASSHFFTQTSLSLPSFVSSVRSRMNILIIIRCWLRETFAHADFNHDEMMV